MSDNRLTLLRQIMELQFTAIELNLFLDTHPDNQEALRDIAVVNDKLAEMIREYERQYGPLFPFSPKVDTKTWRWIEEPWPWEMNF